MGYIYHVSRVLLQDSIKSYAHYVSGRMLDAGSGTYSRYSHHFNNVTDVIKLDVVENDNVDVVGSIENLPFENETFDSILSTQVLEHVEHPDRAVDEMFRVLKPGGHVLVTVPQWNELHEEPHDFWRYTRFGVDSLFTSRGFSVVEFSQSGGFYATRAQMSQRYITDLLSLHKRRWGRIFSFVFRIWGTVAIWLDSKDKSHANRKHTINWVFVFTK